MSHGTGAGGGLLTSLATVTLAVVGVFFALTFAYRWWSSGHYPLEPVSTVEIRVPPAPQIVVIPDTTPAPQGDEGMREAGYRYRGHSYPHVYHYGGDPTQPPGTRYHRPSRTYLGQPYTDPRPQPGPEWERYDFGGLRQGWQRPVCTAHCD